VTSRAEFWDQLARLSESAHPAPCVASRAGWWISDDPQDQARAASECATCPALTLCAAYIADNPERAGVYAGRTASDRNPTARQLAKEIAS
jgi:hypothetical protein